MGSAPVYQGPGVARLAHRRKKGWKTVQLPEELLDRVDELIRRPELGYTSRSEFIKEAVRLRAEDLEGQVHGKEGGS